MNPNEGVTVSVESPAQMESAIVATVPIQWEQNRAEVRSAIVYHRWAALKLRQIARQQAAIDWTRQPGWELMQWVRQHEEAFRRWAIIIYIIGVLTGTLVLW